MQLEYSGLSSKELRLVEQLGINPLHIGLYDLAIEEGGWLTSRVDKKHITKNELGPIPLAEAMRYMGVSGKLSVLFGEGQSEKATCITRKCKITRAVELNISITDQVFALKSKVVAVAPELVSVTTILSSLEGQVFIFASFEFQLFSSRDEKSTSADYPLESSKLFSRRSFEQGEEVSQSQFNHECVTDIELTDTRALGLTNLQKSGLSELYFHKRRHYPCAFITAGLVTLSSRLVAGRQGKRFYSFSVKYAEIEYLSLTYTDQTLKLDCSYIEKAADVDVIKAKAMVGDTVVVYMELGLSIF